MPNSSRLLVKRVRITLQPNQYVWIPINTSNKHYEEYSRGRPSELLITDRKVCLTFVINSSEENPLADKFIASDLNFSTIDSTSYDGKIISVKTEPVNRIAQIQNDFSRRRRRLQLHIKNPAKRIRKLRETRGRQRNRIKDELHKLSTKMVRENPDATFILEELKGIRNNGSSSLKGKRLRTYLNRWPYRMYQSMVEYKSPNRIIYVSPGGTSSYCPVCGDRLEHPTWAVSRCRKCGVDYDRNRLFSLAILLRGLRLCRSPFTVSADASWQLMKNEYLYTPRGPEAGGAGWTEAANAPNLNVCIKYTFRETVF